VNGWRYKLDELAAMAGLDAPRSAVAFTSVSTDTRTIQSGDVFFALSGENFDGNRFVADAFAKGAAAAVTTAPNSAGPCLIAQNPLQALQRFATAHRNRFAIPVIAITGSVGKTTSKDFTAAVLGTKYRVCKTEGNFNNEIGMPISLLRLNAQTQVAVIEMGANHLGEIAGLCTFARPTESAITTIGQAHLEGFGSMDRIQQAKGEIAEALGPNDRFYVNTDDPRCRAIGEKCRARKVYFGREGDVAIKECRFDDAGDLRITLDPVGELRLPLPSRALATSVALAVAIGLQHGVTEFQNSLTDAAKNARRFRVVQVGPLTVLDDTYNANPTSVRAALQALGERRVAGRRVAVLGDMLELGKDAERLHREIGEHAGACGVQELFVRGAFANATAEGARAAGVKSVHVMDAHDAIAGAIAAEAVEGDCLLVKGSRGMRMEKVIESLAARYGAALGTAGGSH
jgi:UDP-N-acetylmuramoyl-tripeptide--D-alanyl-D-alanine ligase